MCLVIGALIGFAACTTPKAANENNFRAAIDLYLSGPRGLECVPAPRVPQSIGPTGRGFWYQRNAKEIEARLGNLWVDSGSCEGSIEVAAEFAAGGLKGSLLFF